MLLVCRSNLTTQDLGRLKERAGEVPNEVRWARRGGRLILLVSRATPDQPTVAALTEDPAIEYVLRDPSEREIARLLSRRDVLDFALLGTGVLAAAAVLGPLGVYLASPVESSTPGGDLFVGRLDQIPVKKSISKVIDGEEFLVVRADEDHLYALGSVCTHSDVCHVAWDADREQLVCPCHRGAFDLYGNVISGPPPRPLPTREVLVREGNVYVKRGRQ